MNGLVKIVSKTALLVMFFSFLFILLLSWFDLNFRPFDTKFDRALGYLDYFIENDGKVGLLSDPWGNKYHIRDVEIGSYQCLMIVSFGEDAKPGGSKKPQKDLYKIGACQLVGPESGSVLNSVSNP